MVAIALIIPNQSLSRPYNKLVITIVGEMKACGTYLLKILTCYSYFI